MNFFQTIQSAVKTIYAKFKPQEGGYRGSRYETLENVTIWRITIDVLETPLETRRVLVEVAEAEEFGSIRDYLLRSVPNLSIHTSVYALNSISISNLFLLTDSPLILKSAGDCWFCLVDMVHWIYLSYTYMYFLSVGLLNLIWLDCP